MYSKSSSEVWGIFLANLTAFLYSDKHNPKLLRQCTTKKLVRNICIS